jgi:hypothetical protein
VDETGHRPGTSLLSLSSSPLSELQKGHIVGGEFRKILYNAEAYLDAVAAVAALEDGSPLRYVHDKNLKELMAPFDQRELHLGARPRK